MRKFIVKIVLYLTLLHVILIAEVSRLSEKKEYERNKITGIAQLVEV